MEDQEALKVALRKASSKAVQAKMDLHDLSEELPVGWERILEVARTTHEAYAELDRLKKQAQ